MAATSAAESQKATPTDGDFSRHCGQATVRVFCAAGVLVRIRGELLALNGLPSLPPAVALVRSQARRLYLNGLTGIESEAAKALASNEAVSLTLNGLVSLDPDSARALSAVNGTLVLRGLSTVSPEAAQALGAKRGLGVLDLSGVTTVPPELSEAFGEICVAHLGLNGVERLTPELARALSGVRVGALSLNGLKSLSPEIAAALLTEDAPCSLSLKGLSSIDKGTAAELVRAPRWDGHLPNLKSTRTRDAIEIAQELAKTKGRVAMPSLARVSARTYLTLVQNPRVELPPVEAITFIPEPDGRPADMRVIREVVRLVCQREADAHMVP